VTSEERERYTSIIDAILATADLETITRKKIRQGLEKSLGGTDLSEQKVRDLCVLLDIRLKLLTMAPGCYQEAHRAPL
jgi:hypothetical protein